MASTQATSPGDSESKVDCAPAGNAGAAGDENNTAITIPSELSQRHPLHSSWALWYLKGDRLKEWEDCLKRVSIFDTVEDFWALYNHIQPASGLTWGSDYYLFKEGIKPMWEDDSNIKGGRWLVVVDKHKRTVKLDQYWLELMMAIIGEQFEEYGDDICGAVVNVRQKGDKVALWTRDAQHDDVNFRIGQILKAKLDIPDSETIRYEAHKDSSTRTGSALKPKITIPARDPAPVVGTSSIAATPSSTTPAEKKEETDSGATAKDVKETATAKGEKETVTATTKDEKETTKGKKETAVATAKDETAAKVEKETAKGKKETAAATTKGEKETTAKGKKETAVATAKDEKETAKGKKEATAKGEKETTAASSSLTAPAEKKEETDSGTIAKDEKEKKDTADKKSAKPNAS